MSVLLVVIIVVASASMKLDHSIVNACQAKLYLLMDLVAKVSSNN